MLGRDEGPRRLRVAKQLSAHCVALRRAPLVVARIAEAQERRRRKKLSRRRRDP